MVSFGHAVYFGLGAYGLAITIAKFGWPMWAGVVAGPLVSAFFGLVYGALCVQLTAIYAAMLTLACAEESLRDSSSSGSTSPAATRGSRGTCRR